MLKLPENFENYADTSISLTLSLEKQHATVKRKCSN